MRRLTLLVVLGALTAAPLAQETEQIADLSASAARISRAPNGSQLTGPSGRNRPEIVSAFLSARHDGATLDSLVPDGEDVTTRGSIHVRLRQRVQGLDVYGTYVRAAMTPAGELVSVVENLAT